MSRWGRERPGQGYRGWISRQSLRMQCRILGLRGAWRFRRTGELPPPFPGLSSKMGNGLDNIRQPRRMPLLRRRLIWALLIAAGLAAGFFLTLFR